MMTRSYWLSFCDNDRPEGERFLGVAIVDVTDADAAAAKAIIDQRFPHHAPDAEWIAAASRKAWQEGCNPGGEMATMEITDLPVPEGVECPRNRLLTRDELARLGHVNG